MDPEDETRIESLRRAFGYQPPGEAEERARTSAPQFPRHGRARRAVLALASFLGLTVVCLAVSAWQVRLIGSMARGEEWTHREVAALDAAEMCTGVLQIVGWIVSAVFFLMWFHRSHRDLRPLGAVNLKYSPRWAVGGFFVPFLCLFRPFQVMREIWNASDPERSREASSPEGPASPLIRWWWGLFVFSGLVGNAAAKAFSRLESSGNPTFEELLLASWLDLASYGMEVPASICAIGVVRAVDRRQAARAVAVGLAAPK